MGESERSFGLVRPLKTRKGAVLAWQSQRVNETLEYDSDEHSDSLLQLIEK